MKRLTMLRPHMTPARWLQTAVLVIAIVALLLAVAIRATSAATQATTQQRVGLPAPEFSLRSESHGQVLPGTVSLDGERGHTVLLLFMFSLCPHCLNQIEAVKSVNTETATGGLRILYIDSPAESPGIISAYAQRLGIENPSTPILLDPSGALARTYGIIYYPVTILIDARGIVRQVWTGETGSGTLRTAIKLLASSNSTSENGANYG